MPNSPSAGDFLLADPRLTDPNFDSTVVLLCEHNQEGSLGLIVNRPLAVPLKQLLPENQLSAPDAEIYWGGPVHQDALHALRLGQPAPEALEVLPGLHFGGQLEDLSAAMEADETVRFYLGYAGWEIGQLESELAEGAWHVCAGDPALAMSEQLERLWTDLIARAEPELGWLKHIPDDPSCN
jgi:putative transcriptional regulator